MPGGRKQPAGATARTAARPAARPVARTTARAKRLATLPALVALFCLAGAIRLALGIDGAVAQGPDDTPPALASGAATAPVDAAQGNAADAGATPGADQRMASDTAAPDDEATASILIDMRRREAALADRAGQIEERLALLAAAEERIARQIEALREAEAELDATMAVADQLAEDDLGRLIATFEAMRAEQAARVFAEMDPAFAAGFLGRLRPETAAGILAGLEPRQAYALSTVMAGRNALVPTRTAPQINE